MTTIWFIDPPLLLQAHNTLFIAELPTIKGKLPLKADSKPARFKVQAAAELATVQAAAVEDGPATPPEAEGSAGARKRRRREEAHQTIE